MNANLWIAVCCVAVVALFAGAVVYATRDKGDRGAGPDWRLPRLHWPRRRRPVTGARAAIRGRLTRIPTAENPDPPRATPFERPLTDWLRDSVVMEAIRITEEGE